MEKIMKNNGIKTNAPKYWIKKLAFLKSMLRKNKIGERSITSVQEPLTPYELAIFKYIKTLLTDHPENWRVDSIVQVFSDLYFLRPDGKIWQTLQLGYESEVELQDFWELVMLGADQYSKEQATQVIKCVLMFDMPCNGAMQEQFDALIQKISRSAQYNVSSLLRSVLFNLLAESDRINSHISDDYALQLNSISWVALLGILRFKLSNDKLITSIQALEHQCFFYNDLIQTTSVPKELLDEAMLNYIASSQNQDMLLELYISFGAVDVISEFCKRDPSNFSKLLERLSQDNATVLGDVQYTNRYVRALMEELLPKFSAQQSETSELVLNEIVSGLNQFGIAEKDICKLVGEDKYALVMGMIVEENRGVCRQESNDFYTQLALDSIGLQAPTMNDDIWSQKVGIAMEPNDSGVDSADSLNGSATEEDLISLFSARHSSRADTASRRLPPGLNQTKVAMDRLSNK